MSEIIGIKVGQTLPPERWLEAADNLGRVFPMIARMFELQNFEGAGQGGRRGIYGRCNAGPDCPAVRGELRLRPLPLHCHPKEGRRR